MHASGRDPVEDDGVGIDGIAVYVPRLYVDVTGEWATARAASPQAVQELVGKITNGIGVRRFAITDAHEDSATMAAMAAVRLIDRLELDPRQIGYLAIGTETTVDQSKSMAAYVLGMLQRYYDVDLSHVGCPQFQFACIGATYALESAAAMIRSGELGDRYAVVVATDVSRYPLGGPAECTQGAGAVAMKVGRGARLLRLDRAVRATVTVDERDFFRPNWSHEAVVDGQYSVDLYLSCLDAALQAVAREGKVPARRLQSSSYFLFHTPFPRMAEYAASRLFRRLPSLDSGAGWDSLDTAAERNLDRAAAGQPAFRAWFDRSCAPALAHTGQVGNIYAGALYLGLASLVEHLGQLAGDCTAQTVTLFSYGSGASAKILQGVVQPSYRHVAGAARVGADLADEDPARGGRGRVALSLADYQRLHGKDAVDRETGVPIIQASVRRPQGEFALTRFGAQHGVRNVDVGYRYYSYVP